MMSKAKWEGIKPRAEQNGTRSNCYTIRSWTPDMLWKIGVNMPGLSMYGELISHPVVLRARLSCGERVWSNSHHHLIFNTPRISWRVNWVSDEWRCTVAFFGMLFGERVTEDLLCRTHPNLCSHLLH